MLNRSSIVVVAAVLACGAATTARADDLAKNHFRVGQSYYQLGLYRQAIGSFQQAYRLSHKPALLYNIGQCHERLGQPQKALDFYQRYLKESGKQDPDLQKKIANLEQRVKHTAVAIRCNEVGALVEIDGKPAGKTPLAAPYTLSPGSHQIRVSKAGFEAFSAFVSVTPGATVEVFAKLSAKAATPPDGAKSAAKASSGGKSAAAASSSPVVSEQPAPPPKRRRRLWTWIVAGTAVACFAAAIGTGVAALNKADSAITDTAIDPDLESQAKGLAHATDALIGVGAAAAIAAVVLFFTEGKTEKRQVARVTPIIGVRQAGLLVNF